MEKLNKTLEAELNSLKASRDPLLNVTKFPKEADERLEAYLREYCSLKDFDFKNETQELLQNLCIPFTAMEQKVDKIHQYLNKLQNKVKRELIIVLLSAIFLN